MKEMAISFIEENNLHNSISLKGKLVGKDLGSEFNRHKILVVPSKWPEPFGIVALEGLACGCKVICSSEGGLPEAVGEFGVLFKNGSVDELAIAMENILNNPPVYDEKRLNIFLEDHNPEKVAVEYLKVFEKR
jgi:glycosyltransferase involved in cell wall biosynthesis